jgi:hypothetical protein
MMIRENKAYKISKEKENKYKSKNITMNKDKIRVLLTSASGALVKDTKIENFA